MNRQMLRDDVLNGRIAQIPQFISMGMAARIAQQALQLADTRAIKRDGYPRHGGRAFHEILDGLVVQESVPDLLKIYSAVRDLAEEILGTTVLLSPYARSGVNIRVYRNVDSEDGWHYDSNPLSALLYLTTGGQPTEFKMPTDTLSQIYPSPGLLLLFNGRTLLHHVPKGDELRITCPLNLYYPNDLARPEYVDKVLFENGDNGQRPSSSID